MEKIFYLPMNEKNFTSTAPNSTEVHFTFQEFIPVAMKLLQLDSNLARVHAKVSPKMDEETFWFNYYCRISFLRAASGIEGASAKQNSLRWKEADVIFSSLPQLTTLSESTAPSQVVHDAENEASSISKKLNLGNNKSSVRSAPSGSALSGSSHQGDNSTCSGADEDATSSSSYLKVSPTIGRDELMGDDDLDLLDELDLGDDEECQENMSEADAELEARIALELAQDD